MNQYVIHKKLYPLYGDISQLIMESLNKWIRINGKAYFIDENGYFINEKNEMAVLTGMYFPWATQDKKLAYNTDIITMKIKNKPFTKEECSQIVSTTLKTYQGIPSDEISLSWVNKHNYHTFFFWPDHLHQKERLMIIKLLH